MPPVHPRHLAQILGADAKKRGTRSENHVFDALALPSRPEWMRSFRKGTAEEDRAGIDFVVESDVGKLFLQVKSSRGIWRGSPATELCPDGGAGSAREASTD